MPGMGRGEDSGRVCDLDDFGLMNAAVEIVVMVLLGKEGVLEETLTFADLFFVMSIFFFVLFSPCPECHSFLLFHHTIKGIMKYKYQR